MTIEKTGRGTPSEHRLGGDELRAAALRREVHPDGYSGIGMPPREAIDSRRLEAALAGAKLGGRKQMIAAIRESLNRSSYSVESLAQESNLDSVKEVVGRLTDNHSRSNWDPRVWLSRLFGIATLEDAFAEFNARISDAEVRRASLPAKAETPVRSAPFEAVRASTLHEEMKRAAENRVTFTPLPEAVMPGVVTPSPAGIRERARRAAERREGIAPDPKASIPKESSAADTRERALRAAENRVNLTAPEVATAVHHDGIIEAPATPLAHEPRAPAKPVDDGNTPLLNAASTVNFEAIKKLLSEGADPNERNKSGETMLHRLLRSIPEVSLPEEKFKRWQSVAELVRNRGADVNAVDNKGQSIAHVIAQFGKLYSEPLRQAPVTEELRRLLSHPGLLQQLDFNVADKSGKTALDYAMASGNEELLNAILKQSANTTPPTGG